MKFLTKPAEGPDSEDPELIDIGEYYLTVEVDYGSCTKEWLKKLDLKASDLEQSDDCFGRTAEVERMAQVMGISDPFYDEEYCNMQYSEFVKRYEGFKKEKRCLLKQKRLISSSLL